MRIKDLNESAAYKTTNLGISFTWEAYTVHTPLAS